MPEDSGKNKKKKTGWGSAWAMPEPEEPSPEDREFLGKLADMVVKRGLGVPAMFLLESFKPFSFIGQQVAVFFSPMVNMLVDIKDYPRVIRLLEYRENIELLLTMIEERQAIKMKEKQDVSGQGEDSEHPGN
ncbi:MAG: hypothetical protein M1269_04945 [Chloroflexi bacterium]|nr:hypothetical protein [Chloroflexota bacterium]